LTLQNNAIHFKARQILGTSAARNFPSAIREDKEESSSSFPSESRKGWCYGLVTVSGIGWDFIKISLLFNLIIYH